MEKMQTVMKAIEKTKDISLFDGKMGVSLMAFINSHSENPIFTKKEAINYLKEVYQRIHPKMALNIGQGLVGIGLSLKYLIDNSYVEGDLDRVLAPVDDIIFKTVSGLNLYGDSSKNSGVAEVLLYLALRLENGWKDAENRLVYDRLATHLLDYTYYRMKDQYLQEAIPYSGYNNMVFFLIATSRLYRMNVHRTRIRRIWREIPYQLFSHFPLMEANRLNLLCGVQAVCNETRDPGWLEYERRLRQDLSLRKLFWEEMAGRQIFFSDGMAGSLAALLYYNSMSDTPLEADYAAICACIEESPYWEEIATASTDYINTGINGYFGVSMFLEFVHKKILSNA